MNHRGHFIGIYSQATLKFLHPICLLSARQCVVASCVLEPFVSVHKTGIKHHWTGMKWTAIEWLGMEWKGHGMDSQGMVTHFIWSLACHNNAWHLRGPQFAGFYGHICRSHVTTRAAGKHC